MIAKFILVVATISGPQQVPVTSPSIRIFEGPDAKQECDIAAGIAMQILKAHPGWITTSTCKPLTQETLDALRKVPEEKPTDGDGISEDGKRRGTKS